MSIPYARRAESASYVRGRASVSRARPLRSVRAKIMDLPNRGAPVEWKLGPAFAHAPTSLRLLSDAGQSACRECPWLCFNLPYSRSGVIYG
jgi:hypothetical protein